MELIVHFDEYCPTCKYQYTSKKDDLCKECLDKRTNTGTRRPVNWRKVILI